MSVATSSTSWRSTRARRRRSSSSRSAGARSRDFGLPEETVDHRKRRPGPGGGLRPARSRLAAGRVGRAALPLRFDLVVVEPDGGPAPRHAMCVADALAPASVDRQRNDDRVRATRSAWCQRPSRRPRVDGSRRTVDRPRTRPVLHSRAGPGSTRATRPSPARARRGAHTRTVPTGTVPAGRRRPAGPRRRGPRRNEPTGGRSPCRPFRCGSCSKPESTSATRPAAGTPR